MKNLRVWLRGRPVDLREEDCAAEGAEGRVFRHAGLALKIWRSPGASGRTAEKISLLAKLSHPFLCAPSDPLFDSGGSCIGFAARWIAGEPLARLFSSGYQQRNGWTDAKLFELIANMSEALGALHAAGCAACDPNEFNWIFDGTRPCLLDADSWSIPPYGPTAVMPSVRDPARPGPCQDSDWFALAALAYQLLCGTHPFKAKIPSMPGAGMEELMAAGMSAFEPGARTAAAARSHARLPDKLQAWLRGIFSHQFRSPPPDCRACAAPSGSAGPKHSVRAAPESRLSASPIPLDPAIGPGLSASGCPNLLQTPDCWIDACELRPFPRRPGEIPVRCARGYCFWSIEGGTLRARVCDRRGAELASSHAPCSAVRIFTDGLCAFCAGPSFIAKACFEPESSASIYFAPPWNPPQGCLEIFDTCALAKPFGKACIALPGPAGKLLVHKAPALDGLRLAGLACAGPAARAMDCAHGCFGLQGPGYDAPEPVQADLESFAALPGGALAEIIAPGLFRFSAGGQALECPHPLAEPGARLLPLDIGLGIVLDGKAWRARLNK